MSKDATPPNLPHAGKPPAKPDDDQTPHNPLRALDAMVHFLAQIANAVKRRPRPFREVCVTGTRCGSQMTAGVLRSLHNPTTADLQVTLSDGTNGSVIVYNGILSPGASVPLYMAFYDGLYCVAGSGAIIGGTFNA